MTAVTPYCHRCHRPRLLDLFAGAGGAAMGYHRAGFCILGVDRRPQPHYPFRFVQADAIEVLTSWNLAAFAAIHTSPPCQGYSAMNRAVQGDYPLLIEPVRDLLMATGKPFVIENVERAPLREPWILCGTQFGLRIRRHRKFECHPPIFTLMPPCNCQGRVASGELIGHRLRGRVAPGRRQPPGHPESVRLTALDVPWMTAREARDAIPPAYTEYIGRQLLEAIAA